MAYRFINKMSDDEGTLCADVDDAKSKLDSFLETCKTHENLVEEHHVIDDEFSSYVVHDKEGNLIGDFTITSD